MTPRSARIRAASASTPVHLDLDQERPVLLCPVCNSNNTHLQGYAPHYDSDDRLCLTLAFKCEDAEQHVFTIEYEQHEGLTFRDVRPGIPDDLPILTQSSLFNAVHKHG